MGRFAARVVHRQPRQAPVQPVPQVGDLLRADLVGHRVTVPLHLEADALEHLRAGLSVLHGDHRVAVAMGEEHRLRHRSGMTPRGHVGTAGQVGRQCDKAGQRLTPAQAGGQRDRATQEKPASSTRDGGMPRSPSRAISASTCTTDSSMPAASARVAKSMPTMSSQGTHAHAAVDRHRAHRRVRKHEAQRRPVPAHQLGHDRGEVMAVGAEAMQPQHGPLRRSAGFLFHALQQHRDPSPGTAGIMPVARPRPRAVRPPGAAPAALPAPRGCTGCDAGAASDPACARS